MMDLLVGDGTVILENIVINSTSGGSKLLQSGLYQGSQVSNRGCKMHPKGQLTRISVNWSSGISPSFAPWCLGMTSWAINGQISDKSQ